MTVGPASAQSLDVAASASTMAATHFGGGFWTGSSATAMFFQHVGVNGELFWHVGAASYNPYTVDLNLALRPAPRRWTPELLLGYAGYTEEAASAYECLPSPTAPSCGPLHQASGALHLGGNVMTYVSRRTFLRFEYHLYIHSGGDYPRFHTSRFAVALGYTFGGAR